MVRQRSRGEQCPPQTSISITGALAEQDSGGVQMIAPFLDGRCVSSNGAAGIKTIQLRQSTSHL
jgi:hypothetical protein